MILNFNLKQKTGIILFTPWPEMKKKKKKEDLIASAEKKTPLRLEMLPRLLSHRYLVTDIISLLSRQAGRKLSFRGLIWQDVSGAHSNGLHLDTINQSESSV